MAWEKEDGCRFAMAVCPIKHSVRGSAKEELK
jgi:hypothetical protein